MMAQGRWQDAIEWFETISAVLKNDHDLFKAGFAGDVDWAIALLATGKIAEAISGLCRAFFYAGAQALLITNWRVETNSARALTTDLFRRQAQNPMLTRAVALRQSKLFLIDAAGHVDPESAKVMFAYAHPIFWAAFSLVGG